MILCCFYSALFSQQHIFTQLTGTPVNTEGWTLYKSAYVGNITDNNKSEVVLCGAKYVSSGAIFYNKPVDLTYCKRWSAEFDFRIFDGSGADGLAFCFLDSPPADFPIGSEMGISSTANGLKVCFDPHANCHPVDPAIYPKIEVRWGIGYNECNDQPTADNAAGNLSFIRSETYNHAKITYDNGAIKVYVNGTLYVSGYYEIQFSGYVGFSASTGANFDNHSIKNVYIYADSPFSDAGTDQTICSGDSIQIGTAPNADYTYQWSPASGLSNPFIANPLVSITNTSQQVMQQTYYLQTSYKGAAACASLDSIIITANPLLQLSIAINASATSICSGTKVKFTATTTNAGNTPVYQWLKNNFRVGANASEYEDSTLKQGDEISCVLTAQDGCLLTNTDTSNPIAITIIPDTPGRVGLGPDTTICTGNTILLNAHAGYKKYIWQDGSTDSLLTVSQPGLYYVSATSTCNNLYSDTIQVIEEKIDLGNDLSKCNNDSIIVKAPAGYVSYSWSPANAIIDANTQDITVFPAATTVYTLTAEKHANCIVKDSVTVFVKNSPAINLGNDTILCTYDKLLLNAGDNFASYQWNTGETKPSISAHKKGSYSVKAVDNNGCISADTIQIQVDSIPKLIVDTTTTICFNNTKNISASTGYKTYLWSNGSTTPNTTIKDTGSYWVKVVDNFGCTGSDTLQITRLLFPVTNFLPPDTAICSYNTLTLKPLFNFKSYLWNTGDTRESIIISKPGTYWLTTTDNNWCKATDTIIIEPKKCIEGFFIPNAFSPNHDGRNDLFKPHIFGLTKKYQFNIYNRWGQLVFTTSDINKGWDGSSNGYGKNGNVFIWSCLYQLDSGEMNVKKGTVVLVY